MMEPQLPARWRAKAADLRQYGAEGQATALEACAAELEAGCLHWPAESIAVRVLAKGYLARHFECAPSDIEFSAPDKYSQPRGRICARPFDRGLSFSHDGRFAAVAFSERLLG